MKIIRKFISRCSVVKELLVFLWQNKLWWLIPIVVMLLIISAFLIFTQTSGIGPFIYALF